MPSPETIDFLSFRRTFTLLILLVVLPSAGLSGFGVLAIINERAAVEKRLEGLWAARLQRAQDELQRRLERAQGTATPSGLTLRLDSGLALGGTGFVAVDSQVVSADPRLQAAVTGLGPELAAVPPRPVVFSVSSTQGTYLLAAMRDNERVVGCQIDPRALTALLPSSPEAAFEVRSVQREVPQGVLARFVSGVTEVREALGPRELAGLTFASPLQDFRLVAHALGGDPVAEASTRNRIWYAALLGLFYVTLALGVLFTARTLYREAQLSRLKTDFVSLVSHELRTPLTSIRMFIEMLALNRVKDPDEMQHRAERSAESKETTRCRR
jgi:two-component system phosphate regulon sensor histidine kinase PhoR